jgi:hypothetical protein
MEPSRNRAVVPARQATLAGGIDSLEPILELLKSLKIRALGSIECTVDQRPHHMLYLFPFHRSFNYPYFQRDSGGGG